MLTLVGVLGVIVAAAMSGSGGLRFVLAAICAMLAGLRFALGVWFSSQRPVR